MKKIIVSMLALALGIGVIIGIYFFIKDQEIKASLEDVERSEFVEGEGVENTNPVASEVSISRSNGGWNVTESGEYTIDPESLKFEFIGYKVGGQHTGTFSSMNAVLSLDELGQPVSFEATFDPSTVKTDSEAVDKHLQDTVFFDTQAYQEARISVKSIEIVDSKSIKAIADITIKGITKTIAVPVSFSQVEGGIKFDIDTKIQISEWDMAFGPVLDDVRVMMSGVLLKK